MRSDDAPGGSDGGPPLLKAVVAGLAALCVAALAVGAADGAPSKGAPGRAALGSGAGLAVTGGRGPPLPPVSHLCFHGPRGEPVDFPAVQHCP